MISSSDEDWYPSKIVHLIGSSYNYSGPDKDLRINASSNALNQFNFYNVTKLVVEIDTFNEELEEGRSIVDLIDLYRRCYFENESLEVVFRKIPGLKYKPKIARRHHNDIVKALERGWQVIDL